MDEPFSKLSGEELIGLVSVVGGLLTGVVITLALIVTPYWRRARQAEAETQLKRDLVAAGFSADDIERVVRASTVGGDRARHAGCGAARHAAQV